MPVGLTEFVHEFNAFPLKLDGFKVRSSVPFSRARANACARACFRARPARARAHAGSVCYSCTCMQETTTEKGHLWADPSRKHLSQLMRRVFTDRAYARSIGAEARR